MGHTSRNIEDNSAESNVDFSSLSQEFSEGRILISVLETCDFGKECGCFVYLSKKQSV